MRCGRVYIEFLRVGSTGQTVQANRNKNHAAFKIDFVRKYGNTIGGVRINMRLDYDSASEPSENGVNRYTPGDLLLKTCPYIGQSDSSARTIRLRYNRERNLRLGDLLETITEPGVQFFGFTARDGRHYGCRDFV
jgi:hypothetical protein